MVHLCKVFSTEVMIVLKKQKKGKAQVEIIVLNIICPETLTVLQVKYIKKFDKKNTDNTGL